MAATVSLFRSRFPEFGSGQPAGVDDSTVERALADGDRLHTVTTLGQMLAAAHLLAIASEDTGKPDGGSGIVTAQQLGPESFTFQVPARADDVFQTWLASTSYGRKLIALEARTPRLVVSATVVG